MLALILQQIFVKVEHDKVVPESMAIGIITLIFKKGDKWDLKNYRPITLMNTDYKILMKVIANRIKLLIGKVVSPTQAYSIPERDM